MKQRTYSREVAELITLRYMDGHGVSEHDGLRVNHEYLQYDLTEKILHWKPVCEMEDWPDSPDALTYPALPYPFTAQELAAFFLDGIGRYVGNQYGFDNVLDENNLLGLGTYGGHARRALSEAYSVTREAEKIVGCRDFELERRAFDLLGQFEDVNDQANKREGLWEPGISRDEQERRRKAAKASVEHLRSEAEKASERFEGQRSAWRKAMVNQLLRPKIGDQTNAPTDGDNLPVACDIAIDNSDSDRLKPITSPVIASCFAELNGFDVERWTNELGSPKKWLLDCQAKKGERPKPSTWWPVLM